MKEREMQYTAEEEDNYASWSTCSLGLTVPHICKAALQQENTHNVLMYGVIHPHVDNLPWVPSEKIKKLLPGIYKSQ